MTARRSLALAVLGAPLLLAGPLVLAAVEAVLEADEFTPVLRRSATYLIPLTSTRRQSALEAFRGASPMTTTPTDFGPRGSSPRAQELHPISE